jgi:Phage integrase family
MAAGFPGTIWTGRTWGWSEQVTCHTLRCNCALAMITAGAPITEVQHRLGHANPAITLQVYSHFFRHTEGSTADEMANVILNGNGHVGKLEKSGHSVGTQADLPVVQSAVSP